MSDIIDGALARIHHAGPELIVGGPNHGPMGAETLVTLGLPVAVPRRSRDRVLKAAKRRQPLKVETPAHRVDRLNGPGDD